MTTSQIHTEETISADEATKTFAELLQHVCEGHSYTITADGRPVARLTSPPKSLKDERSSAERAEAKKELMEHLRSVKVMNAGPWTREELYER